MEAAPQLAEPPPSMGRKIVLFPLVRIVIASACLFAAVLAIQTIAKALPISKTAGLVVTTVLGIPALVLALVVYARGVERRGLTELGPAGALRELVAGVACGALLFATVAGVLAAFGAYRVVGVNPARGLVAPFAGSLLAAFLEEALFRGIVFRITEETLGSWLALVVSAVIFGAVHLMNPNASAWGAISIIVEAGVILAAAYMVTRRLWLPIGIHFAWNFTESGVFGVVESGNDVNGLLRSTLSGPTWLSGGRFGAEASVVAVGLCLAVGLGFLVVAKRRGHVVAPPWQSPPG